MSGGLCSNWSLNAPIRDSRFIQFSVMQRAAADPPDVHSHVHTFFYTSAFKETGSILTKKFFFTAWINCNANKSLVYLLLVFNDAKVFIWFLDWSMKWSAKLEQTWISIQRIMKFKHHHVSCLNLRLVLFQRVKDLLSLVKQRAHSRLFSINFTPLTSVCLSVPSSRI